MDDRLVRLSKAYTPHWLVVVIAFTVFELTLPWVPLVAWGVLIFYAAAVEGVALHRRKKGDTFTEHAGRFVEGGRDRRPLIVGFSFAITIRLLSIQAMVAGEPLNIVFRWGPITCLLIGFFLWLVPHLLKSGRDG